MCSVKREGLQFPVWDANPLIAPLHPDRSFRKFGEHTLSHAQTHAPSRVTPLKSGMGNNLATKAGLHGLNHYHDINIGIWSIGL